MPSGHHTGDARFVQAGWQPQLSSGRRHYARCHVSKKLDEFQFLNSNPAHRSGAVGLSCQLPPSKPLVSDPSRRTRCRGAAERDAYANRARTATSPRVVGLPQRHWSNGNPNMPPAVRVVWASMAGHLPTMRTSAPRWATWMAARRPDPPLPITKHGGPYSLLARVIGRTGLPRGSAGALHRPGPGGPATVTSSARTNVVQHDKASNLSARGRRSPPESSRRTQHFLRPSTPVKHSVPAMVFQDVRHIARRIARARNAYQRLSVAQCFVVHIKRVLIHAEPLQYAHEVSRVAVLGAAPIEDPSSFLATQDCACMTSKPALCRS